MDGITPGTPSRRCDQEGRIRATLPAPSTLAAPRAGPLRFAWPLALGLVLLTMLGPRLYHLQRYVLRGDEGVYLESLLLMRQGYLPFRDFFSSQGPLFLPLLFPFSLLGGVLGPRLGVVLVSMLGITAVALLARRLGGWPAAVAATLVVGLSPMYLFVSKLAIAEAPAAGLAAVAVWLAAREGDRRWPLLSAMTLAAALLIKPMVFPAGLAVLVLVVARRATGHAWRALALDLAAMAVVGCVLTLAVVLPFGAGDVLEQNVDFHAEVTQVEQRGRVVGGWDNLRQAGPELLREGWGSYALAAAGLVLAGVRRRPEAIGAALWLVGTAVLLWIYVPFYDRYLTFLLPPLAILAGVAAAAPFQRGVLWPRILGGAAALAYLATLPGVVAQDLSIADASWEPLRVAEYQAAVDLAAATAPADLVASDNLSIPFMAGRAVPPALIDLSEARVTSGSVKTDAVVRALDDSGVNALVWWSSDRFGKLKGFEKALEARFEQRQQYDADRALYLRRGAEPRAGTSPAADTPEEAPT